MSAKKQSSEKILERLKLLKSPPKAILILGPDAIRRDRFAEVATAQIFKDPAALQTIQISGEDLVKSDLVKLRDELLSLSLFAPSRIFKIQDVQELNAALNKELLEVVDHSSEGSSIFLFATKLAANSVILKYFEKLELVFELPELKGFDLKRWVGKELKTAGITQYAEACIDLLLRLGGDSPDAIAPLVQHLSLYLEDSTLSLSDIHNLFLERVEPSEFELIDALQAKNPARIELMLEQILASGKSPFMLLALIGRIFSNYLLIQVLLKRGRTPADIRQALDMPPWIFNKTITAAKHYSVERLKQIQELILASDSKLKNKSLGPDLVVSELLSRLSA